MFVKGQSGNPKGRTKGTRNKASEEIRHFCRAFVESQAYRDSLCQRLLEGKTPHMEPLVHYYAYGKPPNKIELSGAEGEPLAVQFYLPAKAPISGEAPPPLLALPVPQKPDADAQALQARLGDLMTRAERMMGDDG